MVKRQRRNIESRGVKIEHAVDERGASADGIVSMQAARSQILSCEVALWAARVQSTYVDFINRYQIESG